MAVDIEDSGAFDIAIVGGGINGCGIARDAAGRGLRVYLCEQDDLASGTSSRSTKLIHGGLRYLEHYEFRLVHEALAEREVLWAMAPHIVRPLRFVLPHHAGLRPAWLLRLGLFFYDHLGGRKALPATRTLDLRRDSAGAALKDRAARAFEYSDCWVEDARLVVLNAVDARARGAVIETRHRLVAGKRDNGVWRLSVEDRATGAAKERRAKLVVNAAGPWVGAVLGVLHENAPARARLVKGSHIVVPKLFDHERCYIFQNSDGRIVFAIPYERDFTLVGTTDIDYSGDPATVAASIDEIDYLCAVANEYFTKTITRADVVWSYSGVRSLYDDGASAAQEATRDYVLTLDAAPGEAPLLSVFGGKITTYRRLAEAALSKLQPHLPGLPPAWTAGAALPGGDFPMQGFAALVADLGASWPALPPALLARLARAYGTRARDILGGARQLPDLGQSFGADLTEAEVRYLVREEWAREADDILWRRSKLGLRVSPFEAASLRAYLQHVTVTENA